MSKVDQFESTFRSAVKAVYSYRRLELPKILVVTDLDPEAASTFGSECRSFLEVGTSLSEEDPPHEARVRQPLVVRCRHARGSPPL